MRSMSNNIWDGAVGQAQRMLRENTNTCFSSDPGEEINWGAILPMAAAVQLPQHEFKPLITDFGYGAIKCLLN